MKVINIKELPDEFDMEIIAIHIDPYYGTKRLEIKYENKTVIIRKPKGPNWDVYKGDILHVKRVEYKQGHYKLTQEITL